MPYSLKPDDCIDLPLGPEFLSIPKWVLKQIPKNKHYELNYHDGVWRLDGKVLKQQGGAE